MFFKVKILDIQPIFTLQITAIRHGELKPRSPSPVCLAVSTYLGVYLPRCLPAQVYWSAFLQRLVKSGLVATTGVFGYDACYFYVLGLLFARLMKTYLTKTMYTRQRSCFVFLAGPFTSVNGHLEGHYPAYTMVTYERKKYLIN